MAIHGNTWQYMAKHGITMHKIALHCNTFNDKQNMAKQSMAWGQWENLKSARR
jgi:hypothetical protein